MTRTKTLPLAPGPNVAATRLKIRQLKAQRRLLDIKIKRAEFDLKSSPRPKVKAKKK